ncbi:MAG: tetratricopeptide repeat protein [Bacteroidia bacterium]
MKTIKLTLIAFIIPLFIFSQDAETLSDMAQEKYEQKDYQYALVLIEKAIEKNDTNEWYYMQKAQIVFNLHGLHEAIEALKSAEKINPEQTEIYNRAGMYYQSAGKVDSAITNYDKGIRLAKSDTLKMMYLTGRGTTKGRFRDFEGALKDFEAVLSFNPNDAAVLNNIAPVYRSLGMTDKAILALKKLIQLDSTFVGPYVNLGFTYSKIDSLDLALHYFNKALKIDPAEATTYNNRGHIYYKMGNYDKAFADINKSISLYPANSYAYRNLALVYLATNNNKEACLTLQYAEEYGFEKQYGPEVKELIAKHCKN